ncbi:glutathione S-transferase family protein [Litoreibacter roseus]|uniref:Glutathione S-transferase n=1 Tax=Litoreibacter roseus TaxID=2601869 RepID=A0A6N6JGK3_9RHOB|nr:glutathione S-transferase family protein [Litoreibacter roseus]GFE65451.1 glutathione S-transferase [Litoreibacter roseus]
MTMQLYCFGESGNAYKAALTLELAGVDWQPVFVDFFKGAARSDAFKTLNPMGEVPVLIDGDVKLTQSGVIQQYIVDKTGRLGGTEDDKYEVLRWVLWDNHKMSSQAGVARFLLNFLPQEKRPQEAIAFLQGRLKAAYAVLNDHLDGRDWIVGDALTVADISCCSYLFYDEPFGFDRKDWPHIDAWLARISETPGWKHPYDLMQRALGA